MKLTVYTDGASRGNPGPASYGFNITDEQGKIVYEEGKYIGINTNNVGEYMAVLEAFRWIKDNVKEPVEVSLFADSKLVIEQLAGRYKVKAIHLKPIYDQIRILIMELGGVNLKHVPRERNTVADALANLALDSRI